MKAPAFWNHSKPNMIAKALTPVAKLYSAITGYRMISTTPFNAPLTVICIGNYTMGGAGKTPLTQSLYHLSIEMGFKPCVLTRGYGGMIDGPKLVDVRNDTPQQVGDEPFMMAHHIPVVVCRDRKTGANYIAKKGYNLILMDDGFQNPTLKKDVSFVVVDGGVMLGNQKVFPAGPLREPLDRALLRTNALVMIGKPKYDLAALKQIKHQFQANIQPQLDHKPEKVIAFCGIGRPEKFKDTLTKLEIEVVELIEYPDHHPYSEGELNMLGEKAKQLKTPLITTEKDWVKLPKMWQERIQCLPITLQWDRPEDVKTYLKAKLTKI
ncbi:tetraacyldisaccharide 4'-kinase [Curvivirga sp.]|uniref:tetraacyldisaccharide 4'-kinase n=1 Tax=Curvivirga sp. TaxID=2856848 RepID=UPI003B59A6F6